jgi:hypothetical protein
MKEQCLVSKLSGYWFLCIVLVSFAIFLLSCKAGTDKTVSIEEVEVDSLSQIAGTYKIISIEEGEGQYVPTQVERDIYKEGYWVTLVEDDSSQIDGLVNRKRRRLSNTVVTVDRGYIVV